MAIGFERFGEVSHIPIQTHLTCPAGSPEMVIYEGQMFFQKDEKLYEANGRLYYRLTGPPGLRCGGRIENFDDFRLDGLDFCIPAFGLSSGELTIDSSSSRFGDGEAVIEFDASVITFGHGQGSRLGRVSFQLCNFIEFRGEAVVQPEGGFCASRTSFEFGHWEVTVERQIRGKSERGLSNLRITGDSSISHTGILQRRDRRLFGTDDASKVLDFLYWFFMFCNGSRCGPVLCEGVRLDPIILWRKWDNLKVQSANPSPSWFPENVPSGGLALAENYFKIWSDADRRQWLRLAISFYSESLRHQSGIEMAIVTKCVALELLCWAILVDARRSISTEGMQRSPAADRLRLLLFWMNVPVDIPRGDLKKFAHAYKATDGPDLLTKLRNDIVHPTPEQRQRSVNVNPRDRFYTLWLGIWYVELALLKFGDYSGPYDNRFGRKVVGSLWDPLPWSTEMPEVLLPHSQLQVYI